MLGELAERWTAGWRGLVLAGLIALVAALPGLALPVLDREEAQTAQSTVQMLESGDFVAINFQDQIRKGQAVGVYWPQAATVALFSKAEARQIWAYRIPSIIGAIVAAVACGWGAAAFWGSRTGCLAGAALGASLLASTVGSLATADAVAAGSAALAMAALARIYASREGQVRAGRRTRIVFWAAMATALLAGGWSPGAVTVLTGLLLYAFDRQLSWARSLGWTWGLMLLVLVIGPWVVAITITTDGAFWSMARDPRNLSIGVRTLAALAASFPLIALLPAAAVFAFRHRSEPGVRFAIAWLAAGLFFFELRPAANLGDALLFFPPLAWLAAAGWGRETGALSRWLGALLAIAGAAMLVVAVVYMLRRFGDADDRFGGALTVFFLAVAGAACAFAVLNRRLAILVVAAELSIAGQGLFVGALLPRLELLWPSEGIVAALRSNGLDPADGLVQGPVTVAGYDEPSLVFSLGAKTEFADARAAARAINEGRPVIVEARQHHDFAEVLDRFGLRAQAVATVNGLDYSENRPVTLTIWRKAPS
jgi:4-amino-4-deoxy-L-arabinose transferase-like glycosyltransferase